VLKRHRSRKALAALAALYDKWPAPHELRAVLCSKFKPKDGIEADSADQRYIEDGIPSDRPQITAATPKRLTAGEASNQAELQQMISDEKVSMKAAPERRISLKQAEASFKTEYTPPKSDEQLKRETESLHLRSQTARIGQGVGQHDERDLLTRLPDLPPHGNCAGDRLHPALPALRRGAHDGVESRTRRLRPDTATA
jgi:hypothetical protein